MGQEDSPCHRAWELQRREPADSRVLQVALLRLRREIPASRRTRPCRSNKRSLNQKASSSDEAFLIFAKRCRASRGGQPRRAAPTFNPYTLNEDPQPQVLFTFGFSNL